MNRKLIILLAIAIPLFSGLLLISARAGAQQGVYPESAPWQAKWIWYNGEDRPHNFYLYARKEFELPEDAVSAKIRVTADSRYRLFLNGFRIGQGPVKSHLGMLYYDEWNAAQVLKKGINSFGALVHHYGEWTFSYMEGRGGFLLEADITLKSGIHYFVTSDGSWKVLPATAWRRDLQRMSVQQGFNEIYDARKAPSDEWSKPGFDDTAWQNAVELGAPPMEPWKTLLPRTTPPPYQEYFSPKEIIKFGDVQPGARFEGVDFTRFYPLLQNGTAYASTYIYLPDDQKVSFNLTSKNACKVFVDRKSLVSNYLGMNVGLLEQAGLNATLHKGWTQLLVRCTQYDMGWSFTLFVDAPDKQRIAFSPAKDPAKPGWAVIGPFRKSSDKDLFTEFKQAYGPQKEFDPAKSYTGFDNKKVSWITVEDTDQTAVRLGYALAKIEPAETKQVVFDNLDSIKSPGPAGASATVATGADGTGYMILDFGWEVFGYPRIELESKNGGETIDICYSEVLEDNSGNALSPLKPEGRVDCVRGGVNYADRYITRAGEQAWETFDKRAFRFMLVVVRGASEPVKLKYVGLRFSTFDTGARGVFETSSELLNRIWRVGAYTLQLNMDDSFTDCPWRERGQWWGDARIEILVNYYAFGVESLPRRGILQIGESQRDDGLVAGIYPTQWDNRWLPDYALIWVISAMDYYRFTGDKSLLPVLLPRYEKMFDGFFSTYENKGHLLENVPNWVFIDWAPVTKKGEIAALNAFYYQALRDAAEQFRVGGDAAAAVKYDAKADAVKKAMNDLLWDSKRGVYVDCRENGKFCDTVSQQANSLAVLFDIAPQDKQKKIMEYVMNPDNQVVQAGSPYFSFYILGALRHVRDDGSAIAYVRRWQQMLQWGATTFWEIWNPSSSQCHAWSSAPTYDLSRYVLGVWPAKPGFERIYIEPRPGELTYASGVVPSPRGDITVSWVKKDGPKSFELTAEIPENIPAEIWLPTTGMKVPQLVVDNGEKMANVSIQLEKRENMMGVELPFGGKHTIKVSDVEK